MIEIASKPNGTALKQDNVLQHGFETHPHAFWKQEVVVPLKVSPSDKLGLPTLGQLQHMTEPVGTGPCNFRGSPLP